MWQPASESARLTVGTTSINHRACCRAHYHFLIISPHAPFPLFRSKISAFKTPRRRAPWTVFFTAMRIISSTVPRHQSVHHSSQYETPHWQSTSSSKTPPRFTLSSSAPKRGTPYAPHMGARATSAVHSVRPYQSLAHQIHDEYRNGERWDPRQGG